jgi:hypothetical protein
MVLPIELAAGHTGKTDNRPGVAGWGGVGVDAVRRWSLAYGARVGEARLARAITLAERRAGTDACQTPAGEPDTSPTDESSRPGGARRETWHLADGPGEQPQPGAGRPRRQVLPWHELLRRVFAVDALVCPTCAGPMTVIAFLTEAVVVEKILAHLGLPTTSPPLAPARIPAQADMFEDDVATPRDDCVKTTPTRGGRGPAGERWLDLDDHDPPTGSEDWGA